MKTLNLFFVTVLVAAGMFAGAPKLSSVLFAGQGSGVAASDHSALLEAFAEINPIDAHVHLYKDDPAFGALLQRLKLRILDICLIDDRDPYFQAMEPQRGDVRRVVHSTSGRAVFCTTFSPYDFEEPGFSARAIRQLNQDFADGAVAVKIYKTIGMEIRTKAGKYLMPDDPVFNPVYKDIAAHHRTVVAHLAEPDSCWEPPNHASPDYEYYAQHPQEYAYAHPEWPSKAAILTARDHVLAEHPKLRVVGAHLGSMEADLNEMAQHFDRYPNFAVDTAARVPYFILQPREKVRAFLIKYQDRILYATDLVVMPQDNTEKALQEWTSTYERDWKFFATDQNVEYKGHNARGLRLPESVLRKLYRDNAIRWIPGIVGSVRISR